ncbi:QueT transporter family protein [Virgibacillus soli]|uniref:QueT transporter family protein n=1 Tax=Paracerasibacillus soli TaxID=480284 RepID=A0ABU5CPJ6_9BACI|nr:QueT transporter family protein [Virgibacillus soli]MDY0407744.1 QueT transporter family protein [Virgibacillus soli]
MKVKTLVTNGLIAALYIALSLSIQPIAFSSIQFRLPEVFNHLVVFNKKYFFGIVLGVFITNLFSPLGLYDLFFGVAHSALSLGIIIFLARYIKNTWLLLIVNTLVFTFNMYIVAFELKLALQLPFLLSWFTTAIGEIAVMGIGIPIMYALNKKLNFHHLIR